MVGACLTEYRSKLPCYHVFLEVESSDAGPPKVSKAEKKMVIVFYTRNSLSLRSEQFSLCVLH